MELGTYIHRQFAGRLPIPRTTCSAPCNRRQAGEFDELTAQMMMIILFGAGGESTGSLLGNAMGILATRPELQRQLRENPDLQGPFIEEALRYEPPFRGHYRHVVTDTALGGTDLPAGPACCCCGGRRTATRAQFDAAPRVPA